MSVYDYPVRGIDVRYPLETFDRPYPLMCELCGVEPATHEVLKGTRYDNQVLDCCGGCLESNFGVERRD